VSRKENRHLTNSCQQERSSCPHLAQCAVRGLCCLAAYLPFAHGSPQGNVTLASHGDWQGPTSGCLSQLRRSRCLHGIHGISFPPDPVTVLPTARNVSGKCLFFFLSHEFGHASHTNALLAREVACRKKRTGIIGNSKIWPPPRFGASRRQGRPGPRSLPCGGKRTDIIDIASRCSLPTTTHGDVTPESPCLPLDSSKCLDSIRFLMSSDSYGDSASRRYSMASRYFSSLPAFSHCNSMKNMKSM